MTDEPDVMDLFGETKEEKEVQKDAPKVESKMEQVEPQAVTTADEFFGEVTGQPTQVTEVHGVIKTEVKPIVVPVVPAKLTKVTEFSMSEEEPTGKIITTIYGLKGSGKTALAFSFPGKIACLSFDRKSGIIKRILYGNDSRIKVYDAVMHEDMSSPERWLETSERTFLYVSYVLGELAKLGDDRPDWIVIDGAEYFQQICEMTMRYRNNIMPYQGIANRNLWKERKLYIRQTHQLACRAAKRGLIYSTYVDKDEIVEAGDFITKKDVPKWIDVMMTETDVVIKVENTVMKDGMRKFIAIVESSKSPLPTGWSGDVTVGGIKKIPGSDKI